MGRGSWMIVNHLCLEFSGVDNPAGIGLTAQSGTFPITADSATSFHVVERHLFRNAGAHSSNSRHLFGAHNVCWGNNGVGLVGVDSCSMAEL